MRDFNLELYTIAIDADFDMSNATRHTRESGTRLVSFMVALMVEKSPIRVMLMAMKIFMF
ncbi:MAG: hypothetical protein Q9P01_21060 [Anaerolineae bacterium]|nr:hypothetical protein [Anaerolineae bacterium]